MAYYLIFLIGVSGVKPVLGEINLPSPSHTAGVQQGDLIISVNGIATSSWEKARFAMLEESVSAEQIVLQVQGRDLQIRDRIIDISGLELLQEEQIDLMRDLGISTWRPDVPPVISEVLPDGAAQQAGLLAGHGNGYGEQCRMKGQKLGQRVRRTIDVPADELKLAGAQRRRLVA